LLSATGRHTLPESWRYAQIATETMPETSNPDAAGEAESSVTLPTGGETPEKSSQKPQSTRKQAPRSNASSENSLPDRGSLSSQGAELTKIIGGVLAGLATQAVVLTAVLFYFGWVRAKATYDYFGIDISVLNFSASDYVLHSVDAAFPLLVAIGLAGVVAIFVHEQLRPSLASGAESPEQLVRGTVTTGAVLAVIGLVLALSLSRPGAPDFVGPCVILLGSSLAGYGFAIRSRYGTLDGFRFLVAMIAIALLAFLWTLTTYADWVGIRVAKEVCSGLPAAAEVTVYSSTNLSLSGPDIKVSEIQGSLIEYRFRYSGLRMLVTSGGQYFLLPSGWRQGDGSVIVLPTTDANIRVEFSVPVP
jgi:hypothetical protein